MVSLIAVASITLAACGGPTQTLSPTERPSPTPVPGPTLGPEVTVMLRAQDIELRPKALDVPANRSFVIHFRNAEVAGIPHLVDIRQSDGVTVIQNQESIDGGTDAEYAFDALPPGDYVFMCAIHPVPSMTGTLRVR